MIIAIGNHVRARSKHDIFDIDIYSMRNRRCNIHNGAVNKHHSF